MNLIPSKNDNNKTHENDIANDALNFDLNYLMNKPTKQELTAPQKDEHSGDDLLVDISENQENKNQEESSADDVSNLEIKVESAVKNEIKLSDIFVNLESIKPSSIPPLMALEEKNGLTVVFNFAKDKPREDVSVVVVTIISKNENSLKNILFQAVVPKVILNYFSITFKIYKIFISGVQIEITTPFSNRITSI